MKKTIYYLRNNGFDLLLTKSEDEIRFITDDKFSADAPIETFIGNLGEIEDDSSWETMTDEEFEIEISNDKIIDEMEIEL